MLAACCNRNPFGSRPSRISALVGMSDRRQHDKHRRGVSHYWKTPPWPEANAGFSTSSPSERRFLRCQLPNVPYRQKTFLFNRPTQHAAPGRGAERRWPDGRNPGGQHAPAAPEAIRTRSGTHPIADALRRLHQEAGGGMSKAQRLKARRIGLTIPTNIGEGINEEARNKTQ